LRRAPLINARDDVVVRPEGKHVWVEQRPCRGVVDLTDIARECFQPVCTDNLNAGVAVMKSALAFQQLSQ
jgi:hypothetical protein